MEETKINYYEVGSKEDIVISNTSLSYINPEQGGSPAKFINFFTEFIEFKNSISLERGSLLHDYHEHEDNFVISDVEKPSKMMADWVEGVYNSQKHSQINIVSGAIEPFANGAYTSTKDLTKRLDKFKKEGQPYLEFLFKADGKIAMTSQTRDIVVNSMNALKSHKKANHILFGEVGVGMQRIKELEIYWEVDADGVEGKVKFKAKLDNTIFDFNKKIAYLNDLKSTGKPVSNFKSSFVSYRYYRQLTFYMQAIYQYLIQQGHNPNEWSIVPRVVAVDSTPFYNVHVFTIDTKWTKLGDKEITSLVNRVIWHMVKNEWKYTAEEAENKYDCFIDYNAKDELFNQEE